MSAINLAAIAMYAATAFACALALRACRTSYARGGPERTWTVGMAAMIALAIARLYGLEDALRGGLRDLARGSDQYAGRAALQYPLLALVLAAAAGLCWLAWRQWRSLPRGGSRRVELLARLALAGFALIYAVRIVSLHAVDALLYSGPLRLNYVIEAGLCAVLAASAVLFDRRRKRR